MKSIATFLTLCLLFILAAQASAEPVPEVTYKEDRLTLKAADAPLAPLLRSIAEAADIEIFVSKSVESARVTITIRREPLEPAMRRLLEPFNHMMMYGEKGGKVVLSSINVLSHGESGVPMKAVREMPGQPGTTKAGVSSPGIEGRSIPVPEPPSPEAAAAGSQGVFVPRSYGSEHRQGMSAVMAKEFEIQEQTVFNEIAILKAEIQEAKDPDERDALNVVLMEKLEEFAGLQRSNQSRMESLHRMELFNQMKQQKD